MLENIKLIIKYPFLKPIQWVSVKGILRDIFTLRFSELKYDMYLYDYTMLDLLPDGWRDTFGLQMCDDIKKVLIKNKALHKWRIIELKEKWGMLRLYGTDSYPELEEVLDYYEDLSMCYCIHCGKPVRYATMEYVEYVCKECFEKSITQLDTNEKRLIRRRCRLKEKDIPKRVIDGVEIKTSVDFKKMWGLCER